MTKQTDINKKQPGLKFLPLVFLLILFLILLESVFRIVPPMEVTEKRRLARKPRFETGGSFRYPGEYTSYYNDHFPMRGHFIHLKNYLKLKLLGESGAPQVLAGKNGWLFLDKLTNQPSTVDYYRNITGFTQLQLETWKKILEERRQWLARRGIQYLFVIVPNKNTIYPEHMPSRISKVHNQSRTDQLLRYLRTHSSVHVLDLRPVLSEAKKKRNVYSRTDSHWNDYGAYIAYGEMMKYISRNLEGFGDAEAIPLSRFQIRTVNRSGGDLATMLNLQKEVLREDMVRLEPKPGYTFTGSRLPRLDRFVRQGFTQCENTNLPNILMVHDSFYKKIKPYLSETFSRVVYIWDWNTGFFPEVIKGEKPGLVIDEKAERFLLGEIPKNPADLSKD